MNHLGGIACGVIIVVAGVLFISDASSQINIRLFPEHRARHHFVAFRAGDTSSFCVLPSSPQLVTRSGLSAGTPHCRTTRV